MWRVCVAVALSGAIWCGVAAAESTTFLWWPTPDYAWQEFNAEVSSTGDEMRCLRAQSLVGIEDATQIAIRSGTSTPSGTVGVAIYSNDGTTQITEATFAVSATDTIYTDTGLTPFTLTAGTFYLHCWCASATSGRFYMVPDVTGALVDDFWNVTNARFGIANNACTTGNPPDDVGGMTDATGNPNVLLTIIGTDSP